jgi:tetratricopeptide (TPR) repeat protein
MSKTALKASAAVSRLTDSRLTDSRLTDWGLGETAGETNRRTEPKKRQSAKILNFGLALATKNDQEQAIDAFSKAIALDPKNPIGWFNRGRSRQERGDLDRAIADYSKAIDLDPGNANAYNNRGVAYRNQGDLDRAIADYSKAIDLDPGEALAYNNRGNAYIRKSDFDRAIDDFSKVIELDPKDADAYNNRGAAYYKKGNIPAARADIRRCRELNPNIIKKNEIFPSVVNAIWKCLNIEILAEKLQPAGYNLPIPFQTLRTMVEKTAKQMVENDLADRRKPFRLLTPDEVEAVIARGREYPYSRRRELGWPYHTNPLMWVWHIYCPWIVSEKGPGLTRDLIAKADPDLHPKVIRQISLHGLPWFDFPTGAEARMLATENPDEQERIKLRREIYKEDKLRRQQRQANFGD